MCPMHNMCVPLQCVALVHCVALFASFCTLYLYAQLCDIVCSPSHRPSPPFPSQLPTAMLSQHSIRWCPSAIGKAPVTESMTSLVKWRSSSTPLAPVATRYPAHQHFPPPSNLSWVPTPKQMIHWKVKPTTTWVVMTMGCCAILLPL